MLYYSPSVYSPGRNKICNCNAICVAIMCIFAVRRLDSDMEWDSCQEAPTHHLSVYLCIGSVSELIHGYGIRRQTASPSRFPYISLYFFPGGVLPNTVWFIVVLAAAKHKGTVLKEPDSEREGKKKRILYVLPCCCCQ